MTFSLPDQRFWSKVEPTGSCWFWIAFKSKSGYGQYWHDGKMWQAHRWSFSKMMDIDLGGLELDHVCRTRSCVNPDHLEIVSRSENMRRAKATNMHQKTKTHCPQGHEYTPENTYIQIRNRKPSRSCLTCRRGYGRA